MALVAQGLIIKGTETADIITLAATMTGDNTVYGRGGDDVITSNVGNDNITRLAA